MGLLIRKFLLCPNVLDYACLKCLKLVAFTDAYQHAKNQLHTSTHFSFFHFWECLVILDHAHLMRLNQLLTFTNVHPHKIKLPSYVN